MLGPSVLLFDLDGTLTDPRIGIVGCLRHALDRLAVPSPSDEELAAFIGPPLRRTFASLLGTSDAWRIARAIALYRERFAVTGAYENRVYDGIPEMLAASARAGSVRFVATSKPAIYAERIVRHFGLAAHFTRVYGAELDGRREHKAELLAHLLAAEGLPAEAVVMIGDRGLDVAAARSNGMRSIGVLWGYGSERELREAGADRLCAAPGDLLACVAEIGR